MAEVHVALAAEKLFQIGPLPITNSILTTWIVTMLLVAFTYFATKNIQAVPKGIQNIAEVMVESLEDLVASVAGEKTKVFLPIIATFFFFILFGNYFGLLPGVGSLGFYETHNTVVETIHESEVNAVNSMAQDEHETTVSEAHKEATITHEEEATHEEKVFVPFLRSINADLNTTLALSVVSLLATHYLAIRYLGVWDYIKKFVSPNPIFLFVGILELIGEFTKILSLSFRLFGNIFAGEVLLTTASTQIFAFLVPIPFYFLEILVGFVQALIFAMLTLVFMVILTQKEAH